MRCVLATLAAQQSRSPSSASLEGAHVGDVADDSDDTEEMPGDGVTAELCDPFEVPPLGVPAPWATILPPGVPFTAESIATLIRLAQSMPAEQLIALANAYVARS